MRIFNGTDGDDNLALDDNSTGDTLSGGAGNDTLFGGRAATGVLLSGGEGADDLGILDSSSSSTLDGGIGNDTLFGRATKGAVFIGGDGNDDLAIFETYSGATLQGGMGNDTFFASNVSGILFEGGAGNDTIAIGGSVSNSTLQGGEGNDSVTGNTGDDFIIWSAGNETIDGLAGTDTLRIDIAEAPLTLAHVREDQREIWLTDSTQTAKIKNVETFLIEGEELSFIDFSTYLRTFDGTAGDDVIVAGVDPVVNALEGNDWITLSSLDATVNGGDGFDMLSFANYASRIQTTFRDGEYLFVAGRSYVFDNLDMSNIEGLTGTSSNDRLTATDEITTLRGLGGRDIFFLAKSAPGTHVDGGAGSDYVDYRLTTGAVSVSLLRDKGWSGIADGDTYANIENINGGDGDDTLTGDRADNLIFGSGGDDTLIGNAGDDRIDGGAGNNTAIFNYDKDHYEIEILGTAAQFARVTYVGPGTGDGADRVYRIDTFRFADGDVTYDELSDALLF